MTRKKDIDVIKKLILEMFKANDWLSRQELSERIGKPVITVKAYLDNDISHLIEIKDFKEYVQRTSGKGKTNIEKYRLKTASAANPLKRLNFENYAAVYQYLDNIKYQQEKKEIFDEKIMRAVYELKEAIDFQKKYPIENKELRDDSSRIMEDIFIHKIKDAIKSQTLEQS